MLGWGLMPSTVYIVNCDTVPVLQGFSVNMKTSPIAFPLHSIIYYVILILNTFIRHFRDIGKMAILNIGNGYIDQTWDLILF